MHHGSLRVELNSHVHHHIVCADSDYMDDKSANRLLSNWRAMLEESRFIGNEFDE
jgi:hypothetical protein